MNCLPGVKEFDKVYQLIETFRELVWEIKVVFSPITARLRFAAKRVEKNRPLIPEQPQLIEKHYPGHIWGENYAATALLSMLD
jgi:hypothetical protein